MNFWNDQVLTDDQEALIRGLYRAHENSAFRNNISTSALVHAAQGNGTFPNSVIAALSTLGGEHGCVEAAYELLEIKDPLWRVRALLNNKQKVPGWGNSFFKGEKDPLWVDFDAQLTTFNPRLSGIISSISDFLGLFPNPACYTAAAAITIKMPKELTSYLFIHARLPSWAVVFNQNRRVL